MVADQLGELLNQDYGYECTTIHLSKTIAELTKDLLHEEMPSGVNEYERIKFLIEKGNLLRVRFGKSVLADMAISEIFEKRGVSVQGSSDAKLKPMRICHIIDSVKNHHELDILKKVYRDMFYLISVFSPLPRRVHYLMHEKGMRIDDVHELIDRDSGEESDVGQRVSDTFPQAHFFLRLETDSAAVIQDRLRRFLHGVFETAIITPTAGERAMYAAASAAGNSACLSRQVGAALTDSAGEIISVGWNDVPKSGGGLYSFPVVGQDDPRCHLRGAGYCSNDNEKNNVTAEIINLLVEGGFLSYEKKTGAFDLIRASKLKSLVEFSRSVHAEMTAIILGSQMAGDRVRGGVLYCTTYPCHLCASLIILAGIKEVFYIEPYKKSLATKLHDDAITEDEKDPSRVRIIPFDGISPERYLEFFRMTGDSRKNTGKGTKKNISKREAKPRTEVSLESLPALESLVVRRLAERKLVIIPTSISAVEEP